MKNNDNVFTLADEVDTSCLVDPTFLKELRVTMLRFAVLQLNDKSLAEDAVQEALMGALKNAGSFRRSAALKTWVFSILKNKIADILRHHNRLVTVSHLDNNDEGENTLFDTKGQWQQKERPIEWSQPEEAIKNTNFWQVFETCLEKLPEQQSRILMMREFLEFDSEEICNTLSITTSNLHVMLYRARLRLRECLENRWFTKGELS